LQWGKTVLSLGTASHQNSKHSLSSFQTSYKEREFLGSVNCHFYSPVLWYPFLCGAVISSLVPSPDLSAKRNNDVKSSHNYIFLYSYSVFKELAIICWCLANSIITPHPNRKLQLPQKLLQWFRYSFIYENHLPK
jgi:hypothetical protein